MTNPTANPSAQNLLAHPSLDGLTMEQLIAHPLGRAMMAYGHAINAAVHNEPQEVERWMRECRYWQWVARAA